MLATDTCALEAPPRTHVWIDKGVVLFWWHGMWKGGGGWRAPLGRKDDCWECGASYSQESSLLESPWTHPLICAITCPSFTLTSLWKTP